MVKKLDSIAPKRRSPMSYPSDIKDTQRELIIKIILNLETTETELFIIKEIL